MAKTPYLRQTQEEVINAILHAFGAGVFLIGTFLLIHVGSYTGALNMFSGAVFGTTLFLTFLTSVLYHGTMHPGLKRRFRLLDHASIYLAISGGYTGMFLIATPKVLGIIMTVLIWTIAVIGIRYKCHNIGKNERFSAITYIMMGWFGIIISPWWAANLCSDAIQLFIAGGAAYTLGVYFYYNDYKKYYHTIWHIMVLCGSILHYIFMLEYLMPLQR